VPRLFLGKEGKKEKNEKERGNSLPSRKEFKRGKRKTGKFASMI